MTIQDIKNLYRARPFVPFTIHMADGRSVLVKHPEYMSISPSGRLLHVWEPDGTAHRVDVRLVTDLVTFEDAA